MQRSRLVSSLIISALAVASACAEDQAALKSRLVSEFPLTQPTADNTDIVTAGAILTLQKGDLVLEPTSAAASLSANIYKDGKIQPNSLAQAKKTLGRYGRLVSIIPGVGTAVAAGSAVAGDSNSSSQSRTYVPGEKMWVTKIEVKTDNKQPTVIFELFTDAVNNVRYKGLLKFPYTKDATEEQVDKLIAEVFTVQLPEGAQAPARAGGPGAAPPAPAASLRAAAPAPVTAPPSQAGALPYIPPPPPPADQAAPPVTIAAGQTPEQVMAALGQPQKIVKLAKKETYYYKDLKVVFTAGKVSDVQ